MRWYEIFKESLVEEPLAEDGESLIADYTDLGVSCGYLGNLTHQYDDRSFRVFTRLASKPHSSSSDISIEIDRGEDELPPFDTPAVRAKLDALRDKLSKGEVYRINGFPDPTVDTKPEGRPKWADYVDDRGELKR